MVRSLLFTFAMLLLGATVAIAQSTVLTGNVTDGKEGLIGATVKVLKGTEFVRGSITDYNGDYRIQLDPGTYDVEFSYTGFAAQRISGVRALVGQITTQNITLSTSTVLDEVVVVAYKVPLIEQDKTSSGQTLTSDQIKNLPTRSVNTIVATTVGATSIDGGDVNIKGARSNGTDYYIDGIRVSGGVPPVQDLEQLQVITSGLGAEIGDVTGGIVSGITKGPASDFHGGIDVENSNGLDPYGFLLATANLSGPILKKKLADGKSRTVLGFRLSGQYQRRDEDDPPALPVFHIKESVLKNLEANPIRRIGTNLISGAQLITNDSVDQLEARPYQRASKLDLNGKIDLRITNNIDISLTGTYVDDQDLVDGGDGGLSLGNPGWSILNAHNNPTDHDNTYRGNFRFRHRLGSSEPNKDASSSKRVSITNANYVLQFAYERSQSKISDKRHGDRLFDYGYIGKFDYELIPTAGPNDAGVWVHEDYLEQFTGYTPGTQNPVLEHFNEFAIKEDVTNTPFPAILTYLSKNGDFSEVYDNVWNDMYANVGQSFNRFVKTETDIATLNATVSFDMKLGKSGTHNIQFGLLNEQRTMRSYTLLPNELYLWAGQYANIHLNGLDTTKVIGSQFFDPPGAVINLHPFDTVDLPENRFYREIRKTLGKEINEWVNVNGLTPDQLSLAMFSPRELMDQSLINYFGYDYLGNRTGDGVTFDDFFRSRGEDGIRNFPNAPMRPLYQAAWLKDKFTFNKMIFSLGLRVERFDLNTKVLRDPYSLYKVMDAKTFYATVPNPNVRPNTVGDDFKVYTVSEQDVTVTAYRDGNTWYFPDGRQANDGNVIFGGGVVNPYLLNPDDDITNPAFDPSGPNSPFEDYTPQVNWLPRLAFSFPISEKANFFAHYDILVQRPQNNWEVTPRGYFYFYRPGARNNANLLPERVVDYEVGFQQELNKRSAIKFSAYYREFRDMLQRRTILYVPVIGRYETFGNEDFGTVKGFTWQYDLRRTKNTEVRIAYTLQFADGTGSDSDSQRGLTTRGNIRYLFPLSFDERHNLSTTIDYRFDSGKAYTGPTVNGKDILSNFGVNLLISAASGRPYTAKFKPTRFGAEGTVGSVNGSRLPWRFNIDLRVDKTFRLNPKAKSPLDVNVYLRVSNLMNRLNVLSVYGATGSPTDDGYLATGEGISELALVGDDKQPYLDSYSWRVRNPNNYAQPRRIFLGASFSF